jgi:hypothetical protein
MNLPVVVGRRDEPVEVPGDQSASNGPLNEARGTPPAAETTVSGHRHANAEEVQVVRGVHVGCPCLGNRRENRRRDPLGLVGVDDVGSEPPEVIGYGPVHAEHPLVAKMPRGLRDGRFRGKENPKRRNPYAVDAFKSACGSADYEYLVPFAEVMREIGDVVLSASGGRLRG